MHKFFRFVYLNTYSFLLLFCGLAIIIIPLYKVSFLLLIPQITVSILFLKPSAELFSTWKDKQKKYQILIGKNKKEFRPESFEIFMKAPCGRLLTKSVLKDLGYKDKYKELCIYKDPLFISIKNNCKSQKTTVYINKDF